MENKKTGTWFTFTEFNETSQAEKNRIERKALDLIREYELEVSNCSWENLDGIIVFIIKTNYQMDALSKMWLFFIRDFLKEINQKNKIISLLKIY